LRIFVLDEGDEMLDRGFAPDVERILGYTPSTRQTALFSATVPPWVMVTAARHLHAPVTVRVDPTDEPPAEIEHVVYDVDLADRAGWGVRARRSRSSRLRRRRSGGRSSARWGAACRASRGHRRSAAARCRLIPRSPRRRRRAWRPRRLRPPSAAVRSRGVAH